MKKRILLFTSTLAFASIVLMSENNGPALNHNNRSGAKNSSVTCGNGTCHSASAGATTVSITVDSAGVPVTGYLPDSTYTITITGTNTSSLPKYGFQFASVQGTGSAQTQAGTASGLPANVAVHTYTSLNFVEHSAPLTATGGYYITTFTWTAPTAGAGTVTLYCTLNAVNGNDHADAADISGNTNITLPELAPAPSSVAALPASVITKVYPNPVTNTLQLQLDNATKGNYAINVYDMNGKSITTQNVFITGTNYNASINTQTWAAGLYHVQIVKDGAQRMIQVVKK